jgi:hypothetical protein
VIRSRISQSELLRSLYVLALAVALLPCSAIAAPGLCTKGVWSAQGRRVYVFRTDEMVPARSVSSANSRYKIQGRDHEVVLLGSAEAQPLNELTVNKPLMEALWAPDSSYFVINESDGGVVGTWVPYLYTLRSGIAVRVDLSAVFKAAASLPECFEPEVPNVGIIGWSKDSSEAWVLAQSPPHSSCSNLGSLAGFRVALHDGEVLERLPESSVRRRWGRHLGCHFPLKQYKNKRPAG